MANATAALAKRTLNTSLRTPTVPASIRLDDTLPSSDDIPSVSRLLQNRKPGTSNDENFILLLDGSPPMQVSSLSPVVSKFFKVPGAALQGTIAKELPTDDALDGDYGNEKDIKSTKSTKRRSSSVGRREPRRRRTGDKASRTSIAHSEVADDACSKTTNPAQTRIQPPKVTKPSNNAPSKQPRKTGTEKLHDRPSQERSGPVVSKNATGLVKTISRRRGWTPVKDNNCLETSNANNPVSLITRDQESTIAAPAFPGLFKALNETYAFKESSAAQTSVKNAQPDIATRRRKVNLIKFSTSMPREEAGTKVKSAKKKPRTITEKATEAYRPAPKQPPEVDKVSRGLGARKESRKSSKAQSTSRSLEAVGDVDQPVLRPGEALEIFNQQELVFGTCSQLVKEDSPTLIRDLQQTLLQSEEEAIVSQASGLGSGPTGTAPSEPLLLSKPSKNLWVASARNNDGSLLEADFVDLTNTPSAPSSLSFSSTPRLLQASTTSQDVILAEIEAARVETARFTKPQRAAPSDTVDQVSPRDSVDGDAAHPRGLKSADQTKQTDQTRRKEQVQHSGRVSSKQATSNQMPDYDSWSDLDLQAAIDKYGFKPMKSRKPMIRKLQKCWEAQHPTASAGTSTDIEPGSLRGIAEPLRPAKETPRLQETTAEASDKAGLAASDDRSHLFTKIREAIFTCPPTHDPRNLTWHEKILLYDPIVLEDLTIWLNSKGLNQVGVDEEVAPSFVRDWCESQSICCLWRLNLRGGERSRY